MTDDDRHACPHCELAVGWAMHCLEPAEEAQFGTHLVNCAECARTVADAQSIGAALALAVPQAVPSDQLERDVRAGAGLIETAQTVGAGEDVEEFGGTGRRGRRLTAAHRRARSSRRRGATVLAVAASVLLVAVSGFLGGWLVQLDAERDRLAERAQVMSRVMERVAQPGTASAALASEDGTLRAVLIADDAAMTVVPVELARNDPDSRSYVLWGLRSGAAVALGSFDVTGEQADVRTIDPRTAEQGFTGFALSVEAGNALPAQPSGVLASGQVER